MAQIHEAIAKIMAGIQAIAKDQKNMTQNFKFRGIDQVYNALHPLLAEHGVFAIPEALESKIGKVVSQAGNIGRHVVLKTKVHLVAADGSSVDGTVYGEGMDYSDKAYAKAASVAMKTFLLETFLIPTEDQVDGDADSPEDAGGKGKGKSRKTEKTEPDKPTSAQKKRLTDILNRAKDDNLITADDRNKALQAAAKLVTLVRYEKLIMKTEDRIEVLEALNKQTEESQTEESQEEPEEELDIF